MYKLFLEIKIYSNHSNISLTIVKKNCRFQFNTQVQRKIDLIISYIYKLDAYEVIGLDEFALSYNING